MLFVCHFRHAIFIFSRLSRLCHITISPTLTFSPFSPSLAFIDLIIFSQIAFAIIFAAST